MNLPELYDQLFEQFGAQHWWPAETPFEVIVGSVLTQNTAWINVERAIDNLKSENVLQAETMLELPIDKVADLIRPSGYFNVKAKRLRNVCQWVVDEGGLDELKKLDTQPLREELLAINGVGPETADDILLYAFNRPVFVVDAYTRRLLTRLGLISGDEPYEVLRAHIESCLPNEHHLYNEYHALIVIQAKSTCKTKPVCEACSLSSQCPGSEYQP